MEGKKEGRRDGSRKQSRKKFWFWEIFVQVLDEFPSYFIQLNPSATPRAQSILRGGMSPSSGTVPTAEREISIASETSAGQQ